MNTPKTLIIAEKPSLAREIKGMLASCFGVKWESKGDYSESAEYYLSSFFGHILTQNEPADYDERYKKWNRDDLPIIPPQTQFKYKDGDTRKRGKLLSQLAAKSQIIVNATDPDREGEGIFRIWYEYEKITLPTKRLWATSLAEQDLKKSWETMKDGTAYDNLAAAQRCRMEADWLVGMNGSRAYSIVTDQRLSIGRVQTPTLALIVKRDNEVENYQESFLYSLIGEWTGLTFTYIENKETIFENAAQIEEVKRLCAGQKFALKSFKKEQKTQNPPKPFSMPDLQKEANKKYGFALDKTLGIAQKLYEAKITSYPRTDSPYLPPSDVDKYYSIISTTVDNERVGQLLIPKGSPVPCMKNTDSSHTAIIPTGSMPSPGQLTEDERKIFDLILWRFVTAFLRPKIYDQYTIFISDGTNEFRAIVNRTVEQGFTAIAATCENKDSGKAAANDDDEQADAQEQESTVDYDEANFQTPQEIANLRVDKKKKSKPKYYTPATLLTAMMNVGKTLESAEDRETLKEVEGLGTAATRDKIPVELEKRGYIEKAGRNIKSTVKGREFTKIVKPELTSAALTAHWEQKLRQIEEGKFAADEFRAGIRSFVKKIVMISDTEAESFQVAVKHKCPKCSKFLRENPMGFFCDYEGCGFVLWKKLCGKTIPHKEIEKILTEHMSGKISGFVSKKGTEFSAKVKIEPPDFKQAFVYDALSEPCKYACPCCSKNLKRSAKAISCECGFVLWLEMSGKKIAESDIKALLANGVTKEIKGFKSAKDGKLFDAKLAIDPATKKVKYLFNDKASAEIAKKMTV